MNTPITKFTTKAFWQIDWFPMWRFDYCDDEKCRNSAEHEWRCDGQFFYKVNLPKKER